MSYPKTRVVVTRSVEQAGALAEKLEAAALTPVVFPVIRFEGLPQPEPQPLEYDWLLFTSVNGVSFFFDEGSRAVDVWDQLKVGAVGSATVNALQARGLQVDAVPEEFVGEKLVETLGDVAGQRILLPRARRGRPEIADALQARGAIVDDLPLYDTITNEPSSVEWADLAAGWDIVTFTSPSSVRNFVKLISHPPPKYAEMPFFDRLSKNQIACIGPVTRQQAQECGFEVGIVPDVYTIEGLVKAIAAPRHRRVETENFQNNRPIK